MIIRIIINENTFLNRHSKLLVYCLLVILLYLFLTSHWNSINNPTLIHNRKKRKVDKFIRKIIRGGKVKQIK